MNTNSDLEARMARIEADFGKLNLQSAEVKNSITSMIEILSRAAATMTSRMPKDDDFMEARTKRGVVGRFSKGE